MSDICQFGAYGPFNWANAGGTNPNVTSGYYNSSGVITAPTLNTYNTRAMGLNTLDAGDLFYNVKSISVSYTGIGENLTDPSDPTLLLTFNGLMNRAFIDTTCITGRRFQTVMTSSGGNSLQEGTFVIDFSVVYGQRNSASNGVTTYTWLPNTSLEAVDGNQDEAVIDPEPDDGNAQSVQFYNFVPLTNYTMANMECNLENNSGFVTDYSLYTQMGNTSDPLSDIETDLSELDLVVTERYDAIYFTPSQISNTFGSRSISIICPCVYPGYNSTGDRSGFNQLYSIQFQGSVPIYDTGPGAFVRSIQPGNGTIGVYDMVTVTVPAGVTTGPISLVFRPAGTSFYDYHHTAQDFVIVP